MNRRCTDTKQASYQRYGVRGIKVCKEWQHDFHAFKKWALENGYAKGLTIDRKDNNGGYSPENCRWVTNEEQSNNRRSNRIVTLKGQTGTLAETCKTFGLDYGLVNGRIQKGWTVNKALSTPLNGHTEKNHLLTYKGKTQSITEWAKELGFKKSTIGERLNHGLSVEEALSRPVRKRSVLNGSK